MSKAEIPSKCNSQKKSTWIQVNIFDSFKKMNDLSRKQQMMKIQKIIQGSSPFIIEISDESDTDSEMETITRTPADINVKRKLAFDLSENSDDSNEGDGMAIKSECYPRRKNVPEEMILNKPIASSSPKGSSITDPVDKEVMSDDSDSTIILENSFNKTILIQQHIVLSPEKSNEISTSGITNNSSTSELNNCKVGACPGEVEDKQNGCRIPSKRSKVEESTSNKDSPGINSNGDVSKLKRKVGTGESVAAPSRIYCNSKTNSGTTHNFSTTPIKKSSLSNKVETYQNNSIAPNESEMRPKDSELSTASSNGSNNTRIDGKTTHNIPITSIKKSSNSNEVVTDQNHSTSPENDNIRNVTTIKDKVGESAVTSSSSSHNAKTDLGTTHYMTTTPKKKSSNHNEVATCLSSSTSPEKNSLRNVGKMKYNAGDSVAASSSSSLNAETDRTSQNLPTTPSKPKPSKSSTSRISLKSVGPSKADNNTIPKVASEEVNQSSNMTPTRKKLQISASTVSSPSKRSNGSPSPKKERGMNNNVLKVFQELFLYVSESPFFKDLIEEEISIMKLITSSKPKYFFVILKLFIWLPKCYNIFRFCQKISVDLEDKEIVELYKFLKEKNIVDVDFSKEDVSNLLNDLDLVSVRSICEKFKLKNKLTSKKDMKYALLRFCETQSTLTFKKSAKDLILQEILLKMGDTVRLKNKVREAFYKVFLLGTFTNSALDVQNFFKTMLHTKPAFPEYRIEGYHVFYSRAEFQRYADARRLRDGLEEAFSNHNHIEMMQISQKVYDALKESRNNIEHDRFKDVPHLKKFTAESVYISVLSKGCEQLKTKYPEKVKIWTQFLIKTFPQSHRAVDWYLQLTWLYMRYIQPIDYVRAAKLLIDVLKNNREICSDVGLQQLGERGDQLKVGKKYKIDQYYHDKIAQLVPEPIKLEHFPQNTVDAKARRSDECGKKRRYVVYDSDGAKNYLSVENVAMDYYIERFGYTNGMHCEGSLIKATFTLFFWDLIYNPEILVPGTFISKYQQVPLDMTTPYFYTNRKEVIDKRLRDIGSDWSDSKTIEFVKHSFDMHSHESGFCEPGYYITDAKMLEDLVNCIGRKVLSKIYERLVKNIWQYSSGMPDLLLWNSKEKKSKFVEVKGENDKLSIKQKLWLKYLQSIGANIEVCLVHSMGSKRKKLSPSTTATEDAKTPVNQGSRTPKKGICESEIENNTTPEKKVRLNNERINDVASTSTSKS
nr:fanconi-associated nuclease 1-like [Leptinotarsa decemlineata]